MIEKSAIISDCQTYRYALARYWDRTRRELMIFVMLNPSTADAEQDDPTIRRCMEFAKRENCAGMGVVNLFALRSTDPAMLKKHNAPVGPKNNETIRTIIRENRTSKFVAAWGNHGTFKNRHYHVRKIFLEEKQDLYYLEVNGRTGQPKHPLYIKADTPLKIYLKARENG